MTDGLSHWFTSWKLLARRGCLTQELKCLQPGKRVASLLGTPTAADESAVENTSCYPDKLPTQAAYFKAREINGVGLLMGSPCVPQTSRTRHMPSIARALTPTKMSVLTKHAPGLGAVGGSVGSGDSGAFPKRQLSGDLRLRLARLPSLGGEGGDNSYLEDGPRSLSGVRPRRHY